MQLFARPRPQQAAALAVAGFLLLTACGGGATDTEEANEVSSVDCSGAGRAKLASTEHNGWDVCNEPELAAEAYRGDRALPTWWVRAKNISDDERDERVDVTLLDTDDNEVASFSCAYLGGFTIEPQETVDIECSGEGWEPPEHRSIRLS